MRRATAALLCLVLTAAAGCAAVGPAHTTSRGRIAIECQAFYRPSPGASFQEAVIVLGPENATRSEAFDDLTLHAQFMDDPGEGPSLSLVVSEHTTEREIARQLYQIDRTAGLVDQFIGGHGFTGLNYIFHPTSPAEMQFFCTASPRD